MKNIFEYTLNEKELILVLNEKTTFVLSTLCRGIYDREYDVYVEKDKQLTEITNYINILYGTELQYQLDIEDIRRYGFFGDEYSYICDSKLYFHELNEYKKSLDVFLKNHQTDSNRSEKTLINTFIVKDFKGKIYNSFDTLNNNEIKLDIRNKENEIWSLHFISDEDRDIDFIDCIDSKEFYDFYLAYNRKNKINTLLNK